MSRKVESIRGEGIMLYQINTRLLLGELGPGATLDALPDDLWDRLARLGLGWIWLLGVWQTGPAGRAVSRTFAAWQTGFRQALPDLTESDVIGSPFAVHSYTTDADLGGDAALARLRERLHRRGLKLMLDFVPNHVALDHPWARSHPEWLIHGSDADLATWPANWTRQGGLVLAHGRDPYFPGWPDTLQLSWFHPGLRAAVREEMLSIARRCDGVRCDMAMLLLPDVFRRTWGERARPADGTPADESDFWPGAIEAVRRQQPGFVFLAEVYWDREWDLLRQGFDYTYDKRLYDRLRAGAAGPVRDHLKADLDFQRRCARFVENHDEPRAAAVFAPGQHQAAAVITYLTPGLRFFHEGQWQGRRVHASIHLGRRPAEPIDEALRAFYARLLAVLSRPEVQSGQWQLCESRPAWAGNTTAGNYLAWRWQDGEGRRLLAAVNYAGLPGQCFVALPGEVAGRRWQLRDLLGEAVYERDGDDLARRGLYLDVPAWGHHAFEVTAR
jgi:hypothetical protein